MRNGLITLVERSVTNNGGDRQKGLVAFSEQMVDMIEDEKYKLDLSKVSLLPLYEAMVDRRQVNESNAEEVSEAVAAAGFPALVSALLHPTILRPYENIANVVMPLVTETTSRHPVEHYGGFGALDGFELVREGMPYEESQPGERKATITNYKFGRIVSVTREMILFDQTGDVLTTANRVGDEAGIHLHQLVVQKSCDLAVTATGEAAGTSLKFQGSAQTMYANTHAWDVGSPVNDNLNGSALSAEAITTVDANFASILDDKGKQLLVMPKILLVHTALRKLARQLVQSPVYQWTSAATTTSTETQHGVMNPHQGDYTIINTPFVDSATAWYLGDFARQTVLQWVERLQTTQQRNVGDAAFENDIVARFKASYFLGCGCTDYRYVQKGNT